MSTSLKSAKTIAILVKTLISHHSFFMKSENPIEFAYGDLIDNFMSQANEAYLQQVETGFKSFDAYLFNEIAKKNSESYFDSRTNEETAKVHIDILLYDVKVASEHLSKLDNLALPNDGAGIARFTALVRDVIHGLDDENDPLTIQLNELERGMPKYAVLLNKDMPTELPSYAEAMRSAVSCWTWGDKYFGLNQACKTLSEHLERECLYIGGEAKRFWPSDIATLILSQQLKQPEKIQIVPHYEGERADHEKDNSGVERSTIDTTIRSMSYETGLPIKIQGDIPLATKEDAFILMKMINDAAASYEKTPNSQFIGLHGIPVSNESIEDYKNQVALLANRFNRIFVSELSDYKGYWGASKDKEREEDIVFEA
jgi:hypothetical protein